MNDVVINQIVSWVIEEGLEHLLSFADEIRQIAD